MSCPDCTTGGLLSGEPTGVLSTLGAYFSAAPSPPEHSNGNRAIILLTDGFGLPLKNCKILADRFSKELNCDVWVPDYFDGQGRPLIPVDQLLLPDRAGVKLGLFGWINFILKTIPGLPAFIHSRPSVADSRILEFITTIQREKNYDKVGLIGYCYGGSATVRFGATDVVHSVVICHPGGFSLDEAKAIRVPAAWVCAEDDLFFSQSLRLKTEAMFAQRKDSDAFVEYEFKVYKGTAHGFAARPNLSIPEVKEAHEQGFQQAVDWFAKTISV